jgi:hypothetical protein
MLKKKMMLLVCVSIDSTGRGSKQSGACGEYIFGGSDSTRIIKLRVEMNNSKASRASIALHALSTL